MVSTGDVVLGELFLSDGITPQNGDLSRMKMLVILGMDVEGNYIGSVVINSEIKSRNIESQYPISHKSYSFLKHPSFVNCDNLLTLKVDRVNSFKLIGKISIPDLEFIRKTVIDSKVVKGKLKKKFNLFSGSEIENIKAAK